MHVSSKSRKSSDLNEGDKKHCGNNCSHIQVIVCSCGSSSLIRDIRFTEPENQTYITSLQEVPRLQNLLSNLISSKTIKSHLESQQANLQLLSRATLQLQNLNLPSRASKYIWNPLLCIGLGNRVRIKTQGWLRHLSWRLLFNIIAVIVWVLVRKLLEFFGIRFQAVQFPVEQERQGKPADIAAEWESIEKAWQKI